jgi:hypothetical protein
MAQLALRARPAAAGLRRVPLQVSAACPFGFGSSRTTTGVPKASATATADTTLLARLGGEPALNATLEAFYGALPKDPRVEKFFAKTDLAKLKAHQVRICAASGVHRQPQWLGAKIGPDPAGFRRWSRRGAPAQSGGGGCSRCAARRPSAPGSAAPAPGLLPNAAARACDTFALRARVLTMQRALFG